MNRLLLIAGLVLVLTGAAHAGDRLPAVYLGQWCPSASEHFYPLEPGEECAEGTEILTIKPNEFVGIESGCRFRSIRKTGERWPNHTKPSKADWTPVMEIIARCDELESSAITRLRLIYAKGTLRIESKVLKRLKVD
jgi:hypothetical protein